MKNVFFVSIDTTDKAGGIIAFLEIEPTSYRSLKAVLAAQDTCL